MDQLQTCAYFHSYKQAFLAVVVVNNKCQQSWMTNIDGGQYISRSSCIHVYIEIYRIGSLNFVDRQLCSVSRLISNCSALLKYASFNVLNACRFAKGLAGSIQSKHAMAHFALNLYNKKKLHDGLKI